MVCNEDAAFHYLQNISYYRLRAYTYPFQENEQGKNHYFTRPDITLENIIDLYRFDSKLRAIVFSAIEKIEVVFRTRIALASTACAKEFKPSPSLQYYIPLFTA